MAVTTALCADRAVVAAGNARPQMSEFAGRIVQRLTQSFRHTVAEAAPVRPQPRPTDGRSLERHFAGESLPTAHQPVSPFRFRLPPPSLA